MGPNERRLEIMETLCHRRHETMENLAFEFGVSVRTIRNDIDHLSLSYPLETVRGRYGGGVKVMDGFYMNRKYLNHEQKDLLERLRTSLSGNDRTIMNTILKDFALN
jgi:predicted DNA-binding transcriptional regulator YafY